MLSLFSRLLQVRGVVLPIVNACLHLAAELADGSVLVGQHHFCRLTQPVRRLYLTVHEPGRTSTALTPCRPPLSATAAPYLQSGALRDAGGRLAVPPERFLISDAVIEALFET